MKDSKIASVLGKLINVAEFISIGVDGGIRHNCTNSECVEIEGAISSLIERKGSVNVRSFSKDNQQKSTRFIMGITDVSEVLFIIDKNKSENLISIVNENIDVNDGGVSGVILGDSIEFSPNDTPRCVEKEGVCSLPLREGISIINMVYGVNLMGELGEDVINSHRIEFSIHLEPQGVFMKRYTVWEMTKDNSCAQHHLRYPNNFSRMVGDKAFGLLVAHSFGLFLVPKSLVISRNIPPFSFGCETYSNHQPKWTRTAPVNKVSGKFHTSRRWEDPYLLMQNEEAKGQSDVNVASLIIQDGVDAIYSGAGIINGDKCMVEVVKGFGDDFMVGERGTEVNEGVSNLVVEWLHKRLLDVFGNCSFEWVVDGEMDVWLVQVNQIDSKFDERNIVLGECSKYIDFNVSNGLEKLREVVDTIKGTNLGINLIGNIGVTSHFGDILRINNVVSKITNK